MNVNLFKLLPGRRPVGRVGSGAGCFDFYRLLAAHALAAFPPSHAAAHSLHVPSTQSSSLRSLRPASRGANPRGLSELAFGWGADRSLRALSRLTAPSGEWQAWRCLPDGMADGEVGVAMNGLASTALVVALPETTRAVDRCVPAAEEPESGAGGT
jgi:hypothetical protein